MGHRAEAFRKDYRKNWRRLHTRVAPENAADPEGQRVRLLARETRGERRKEADLEEYM